MAINHMKREFLRNFFFGVILSSAALFLAYLIGGGGELPIGDVKDISLALIRHPLPCAGFAILMGALIGIGSLSNN